MDNICEWTTDNNGGRWDTECGNVYFPYVKYPDKPQIKEDGEGELCPWCGKKISYKNEDEEDDEDYNEEYDS